NPTWRRWPPRRGSGGYYLSDSCIGRCDSVTGWSSPPFGWYLRGRSCACEPGAYRQGSVTRARSARGGHSDLSSSGNRLCNDGVILASSKPLTNQRSQSLSGAMTNSQHVYEVRPRKDRRGLTLI